MDKKWKRIQKENLRKNKGLTVFDIIGISALSVIFYFFLVIASVLDGRI